jgi:hypothetical protein
VKYLKFLWLLLRGSMAIRKRHAALLALMVASVATAQTTGTATWSYVAPTQYTDGTAIPSTATITYNLYVGVAGTGSEAPTPVQTGIRFTSAVTSGYTSTQQVCGFVTAVVAGIESAHSSEACQGAPVPTTKTPGAPSGLTVVVTP